MWPLIDSFQASSSSSTERGEDPPAESTLRASVDRDINMGSTEIINRTTRDMDIEVGNCRYFVKLTTVAKNQSYTVHMDYNDTYREFSLGGDAAGKSVIVNSDECVDNKKIIIREVDGEFEVDMEPRARPALRASTVPSPAACEPTRGRPYLFWRLWIF